MIRLLFFFSSLWVITFLFGCQGAKKTLGSASLPSLSKKFKDEFAIGTALNMEQVREKNPAETQLITQQFSTFTPENNMKSGIIHPEWSRYDFRDADEIVAFGKRHGLQVNAHALIWHSQLPPFVSSIQSADSLRLFFKDHIKTVASRYDGKVYSWDVVNEALNDDGTLRKSIFLEKMGEEYIVEAFRLAQASAPNTLLYYNDYSIEHGKKREGAIALIKKIQAAGVRIDGVGIQGHWSVGKIPYKDIEESIIAFSRLGIKVMITELDLSVLPNPWDGNSADVNKTAAYDKKMNPYIDALPDSVQTKLSDGYKDLFALFSKHKSEISRVTFWGVNDRQSWLNDWPIHGRTNYPLLFDRDLKPKPAFYSLIGISVK